MNSLREISDEYGVSIFDALELYSIFGYDKLPEKEKALKGLHKAYAKAQLPYLKMEATGESEKVLASSAQELLESKDGPKAFYIAYSLSHFVNIPEIEGQQSKSKLLTTARIAYYLLENGETYQTITLIPASVFEQFTTDLDCQEFLAYYALIVKTKQEDTVKFLEAVVQEDESGLRDTITDYLSHSVKYEKKQEKIETAKTVGKIGVKVGWGIGMNALKAFLAPWAGIATAIVAGVAAVDALAFIVGLICGWSFTWFLGALGAIGAVYLIYSYWIESFSHPVRTLLCIWVAIPSTLIGVICFIVNIVKAIAGAFA